MLVSGYTIFMRRGERAAFDVAFYDADEGLANIESLRTIIFEVESTETVYESTEAVLDVTGLQPGAYWYEVKAQTDLGEGQIGPHRLYVQEGKE